MRKETRLNWRARLNVKWQGHLGGKEEFISESRRKQEKAIHRDLCRWKKVREKPAIVRQSREEKTTTEEKG